MKVIEKANKKEHVNRQAYVDGLRDGLPIALGYLAVAFSLGMMARKVGMTPAQGFLSSILNHASAGEYAEITVIAATAPYWEMALIILITNARYLLMSLALSQRVSSGTRMLHRILVGFGITDELFGANVAREGWLNPYYSYGIMTLALPFWASGTAFGILLGNVLPKMVVGALSVALYGMFLAIIIPPAKKDKVIAVLVVVSFTLSFLATKLPGISQLSESMRTIILTVVISAAGAYFFPVAKEAQENDA